MRTPTLIVSFLILVSGCAVATIPQTAPFNEQDFQAYASDGSATITGQAFMKTRGGDVKVGAGNQVELIPATPYTRERVEIVTRAPYSLREPRDPRLSKYVRSTIADANGNFEFKNVPAGDYILHCTIEWRYVVGSSSAVTGGQAFGFVSVSGDDSKKVIVTR